jgi:methylated-DNA-protein-cysteine methyltransferase-like protein
VTPQEYVEQVLSLVERIPIGKVMSYGAIADALADVSGRNSARQVGTIMARHGGGVPWHRVVTRFRAHAAGARAGGPAAVAERGRAPER